MTEETPGFEPEPDVPAESAAQQPEESVPAGGSSGGPDQAPGTSPSGGDSQDSLEAELLRERQEAAAITAQLDQARSTLNDRTQDLQRLQAEFQNYRRRVERDRAAVKEMAVANVLTELLPVLDDIGRARDHGELVGSFKSMAESLETVVAKMGLVQFGAEGEPFDPTVHEALMHSYSPDVTETTCVQILLPGYRIGERTIRPARVGVAEPQPGAQSGSGGDAQQGESASDEESGGPEEG